MLSLILDVEQWVWCPHDQLVWTKAKVLSLANEGDEDDNIDMTDESKIEYLLSFSDAPGVIKRMKGDQVHRVDITHLQDLDNLCLLNDMHEAPLLDLLRRRFFDKKIYTFTGDVLISINPYEMISSLYASPLQYLDKKHVGHKEDDTAVESVLTDCEANTGNNAPHVFRTANRALESLAQSSGAEPTESSPATPSGLVASYTNQSIIISGESGAGKTENSKFVLNFLIHANNYFSSQRDDSSSAVSFEEHLKAVLVNSSVVLEAFGNAKTVRNDNSSRFGKYIKLLYLPQSVGARNDDTFPHLVSATTETFLLEKSRLSSVGKGERTYHVFYQLLCGLDADRKASLCLDGKTERDFSLLSQGNSFSTSADCVDFENLIQALSTLQFTHPEIEDVYRLLACILHLSNLTCTQPEEESSVAVKIDCTSTSLDKIADWLGVQTATLTIALTTQELTVARRASIKIKILSAGEVENNIFALIKWLYSKLFDYIVKRINQCHQSISSYSTEQASFIGILDIFGFEILNINSFEQLCINFTNERLQQQFNEHVFISEQAMYASEGLEWSNISFKDNQGIIDVIASTKKPLGLLCVLEEQGLLNRKPDDIALISSFNQVHESNPANIVPGGTSKGAPTKGSAGMNANALYSKSRFGNNSFVLKHFAGEVLYTIDGFLAKNNDALQEDLMKLLTSTSNDFLVTVGELVPKHKTSILASISSMLGGGGGVPAPAPAAAGGKKMAASASISNQFRLQLDNLMSTLRNTTPHYIKCIKPNTTKQPQNIDSVLVLQQLRYSGVLEVVRIRREGFPLRLSFAEFLLHYHLLLPNSTYKQLIQEYLQAHPEQEEEEEAKVFKHVVDELSLEECKEYCVHILKFSLNSTQYQIGHTKIFLRHDGIQTMKDAIKRFYAKHAIVIQAYYRRFQAQKVVGRLILGVCRLQSMVRMMRARKLFKHTKHAACTIKYFYICKKLRKQFIIRYQAILHAKRVKACTLLQSLYRMHKQHKKFVKLLAQHRALQRKSSIRIQTYVRRFLAYKAYRQLVEHRRQLKSILKIQSVLRRWKAYKVYQAYKKAVVRIQSIMRMHKQHKQYTSKLISVFTVQAQIRRFICKTRYRAMQRSTLTIQTLYRAHKARQWVFLCYNCVICIQTWVRKVLIRRKFVHIVKCLCRLQAQIRTYVLRKRYRKVHHGVLKLQSVVRCRREMFRYNLVYAATIAVQACVRRHIAQQRFLRAYFCIVKLQAVMRGHLVYRTYHAMIGRVIVIQTFIRRAVRVSVYKKQCRAIQKLQSWGRMLCAYKAFTSTIICVIMVQCFVRKSLCRCRYVSYRTRCMQIQTLIRGFLARVRVGKQIMAIIRLQSFGRMICAYKAYTNACISIIIVQSFLRRAQMQRAYQAVRSKVIRIQSFVRAFLFRRAYKLTYSMVCKLQAFGRMIICRQNYDTALVSILTLQTLARKFVALHRYKKMQASALCIQSVFRMHIYKREYVYTIFCVNTIAKHVRTYLIQKLYKQFRNACIRIQVCIRSWLRNLRLFRRVKGLHYACSTSLHSLPASEQSAHIQHILTHLQAHPDDRHVRFVLGNMRTLLHSCILGRNESLIQKLQFTVQEVLDIDKYGRNSMHYIAHCGNLACLQICAHILNTYTFTQDANNMQSLDDDDDDEKDTVNEKTAQLRQAIAASVGKGLLKQGWLKKKRGGYMWQKRYVVLTEDYIIYYKNQNSLQHPKFAIPLLGCTINRIGGKDPVLEVCAPNMGEKKGIFFSSSTKKSMMFMCDNEKELQEWLVPLKAVAGVQNLRSQPVVYINTSLRSMWVNSVDLFMEGVLHVLARKAGQTTGAHTIPSFYDTSEEDERCEDRYFDKNQVLTPPVYTTSPMQSDVLPILAWCVEYGANINGMNCDDRTPLFIAIQSYMQSLNSVAHMTVSGPAHAHKHTHGLVVYTPKDMQDLINAFLLKGSDIMLQGKLSKSCMGYSVCSHHHPSPPYIT
ncbi:hypothetical protein EON65_22400 [archaeon]|nr:MAG: hypothetical protein EON65_22400 [archaeon]